MKAKFISKNEKNSDTNDSSDESSEDDDFNQNHKVNVLNETDNSTRRVSIAQITSNAIRRTSVMLDKIIVSLAGEAASVVVGKDFHEYKTAKLRKKVKKITDNKTDFRKLQENLRSLGIITNDAILQALPQLVLGSAATTNINKVKNGRGSKCSSFSSSESTTLEKDDGTGAFLWKAKLPVKKEFIRIRSENRTFNKVKNICKEVLNV